MRLPMLLLLLLSSAAGHAAPSRATVQRLLDDPGTGTLFNDPRVLKSAPFKRWLRERGNAAPHGQAALRAYLQASFASYEPRALAALREASLDASLRAHGVKAPPGLRGRKLLEWVSANNRERLIGDLTYESRPEMHEAERLVGGLAFQFLHNSPLLKQGPQTPLVSSQQLMKLGYPGGIHSLEPFNREFLKTGDNVYFWAHVRRPGEYPSLNSEYGWNYFYADHDYAAKHGYISYRLMLPEELVQFGESYFPDTTATIAAGLRRALPALSYESASTMMAAHPDPMAFIAAHEEHFRTLRDQLHLLDFTVPDLEAVVRTQILHQLDRVQRTRPWRLPGLLEPLRKGDPDQVSELVKTLGLDPLGLPLEFEMKLPVAMPPSAALPTRR